GPPAQPAWRPLVEVARWLSGPCRERTNQPPSQPAIQLTNSLRFSRAQISRQNGRIRVDSAVAEEGPVAPCLLDQARVALRREDRIALTRLGEDAAERVGDERMAEELDPVRAGLLFVADAIRRSDEYAVGDRVRALDRAPRVLL